MINVIAQCDLAQRFTGCRRVSRLRVPHVAENEQVAARALGVGLVATMAALVLGLLITTAKSSFDTLGTQIKQITDDIVILFGEYSLEQVF